ncbi:RBBP9/YdeN family alpha/beta hydrolase [Alloalcanivorax xenomutans]|uniref:RBBP9/YdeN family alpha/beta hydrolase n=1 Tax=Alloalcanivorax xenomutans TaxID=1094342 RepID=UPI003BAD60ED
MSLEHLIIPGWHGSGQDHWQSHWQARLPTSRRTRVRDWQLPDREDWIEALHHLVSTSTADRVILIAHSLGCVTVAHWARRHGQQWAHRVAGALLVAPADVERDTAPAALRGFAPVPMEPLPFRSILIGSSNDRAASAARAEHFAEEWGSDFELLEGVGHINVASGHHHWDEGRCYLRRLTAERPAMPTAPRITPSAVSQAY